jgi:gamma-carbonic anhydrase
MIRSFRGVRPSIGEGVYVDPSAQVIGDVTLDAHASVWMGSVLRGDINSIRIGARTNIQDNCVVHVTGGAHPTVVAEDVTVGHSVTLHGCTIGRLCLIGMGATILDGVSIGEGSVVGAGSLLPEGMTVPPGRLVMGVPARVLRETSPEERERIRQAGEHYVELKEAHRADVGPGEGR